MPTTDEYMDKVQRVFAKLASSSKECLSRAELVEMVGETDYLLVRGALLATEKVETAAFTIDSDGPRTLVSHIRAQAESERVSESTMSFGGLRIGGWRIRSAVRLQVVCRAATHRSWRSPSKNFSSSSWATPF